MQKILSGSLQSLLNKNGRQRRKRRGGNAQDEGGSVAVGSSPTSLAR